MINNHFLRFNFSLVLLLVTFFVSGQEENMRAFEQSLRPEVVFEDEPLLSLSSQMKAHNTPALSVATVEGYKVSWASAYGNYSAESDKQVTKQTAFQSASISKFVNAIGVMKLVERGLLDLDKDIHEYMKSWKIPPSDKFPNAVITTRMLLAHTAGLSTHGFGGYKSGEGLPSLIDILEKGSGVNSDKLRRI